MSFARFMAGPVGRGVRILAGGILVVVGLAIGGTAGVVTALIGVLPIAAGLFNVCVLGPLFGAPFSGWRALEQH